MNCKGKILDLSTPVVMGILNATPDSFYTKGRGSSLNELVEKAIGMLGSGATLLDIGGQSTRPGATMIAELEESKRVLPVIERLHDMFPSTILSVDTFRSSVARQALEAGADIVNDISAADMDPRILEVVREQGAAYIGMHMQGQPHTMQQNPQYDHVNREVYTYFKQKLYDWEYIGLTDVILDVGFGFGKTLEHNYQLLAGLDSFQMLQKPLLVGLSRKAMICKPLGVNPEQALNGTTALHMVALQKGASILRVHDVEEAVQCIKLYNQFREAEKNLA